MTAEELAQRVEEIRREWEAKAAAGDPKAKRMLAECYGRPDLIVVDRPDHWSEGSGER
jgi:DNA invertase Pin-like site-specific DNA recombinase